MGTAGATQDSLLSKDEPHGSFLFLYLGKSAILLRAHNVYMSSIWRIFDEPFDNLVAI